MCLGEKLKVLPMKNLFLLVCGAVALVLTGCGSMPVRVGAVTLWDPNYRSPLDSFELPAKPVRNSETSIVTLGGDSYYHSQGSSVNGYQNWSLYGGYNAGVSVNTWNNTTVYRAPGYYYPPQVYGVYPTVPSAPVQQPRGNCVYGTVGPTRPYR